jgi:hypothetical protein
VHSSRIPGFGYCGKAGHALKLQHKAKRFNHIVHIAALPPAGLARALRFPQQVRQLCHSGAISRASPRVSEMCLIRRLR